MRRLAATALAAAGLAAACSHDDKPGRRPDRSPAGTLRAFVRAAGAGDTAMAWRFLSKPTHRRFGSARSAQARRLGGQLSFFGRSVDVRRVLTERIGLGWAVAAIAGHAKIGSRRAFRAYAAALRLEDGSWRVELAGPVRVRQIGNSVGRVAEPPIQFAAELSATEPIAEGGMWLDGRAFPTQAGGTSGRLIDIFGRPPGVVGRGEHTIVAFARAGDEATALAWTLTVAEPLKA